MNIQYNDFIIDFERVNSLTSHPNDNPNSGTAFAATFMYGLTRKILKEYLEVYSAYNNVLQKTNKISTDDYNKVCEILQFNRILVSKADIRDGRLNEVLDDCQNNSRSF